MIEASADDKPDFKPAPRAAHVTHAWHTTSVFAELTSEAQRRRLHTDALTALILERVITGGLVDHILDR